MKSRINLKRHRKHESLFLTRSQSVRGSTKHITGRKASVHSARKQRTSLNEGRSLIIDYVCCWDIWSRTEQKCMKGFGEERDHFEHLGVHVRVILKWI